MALKKRRQFIIMYCKFCSCELWPNSVNGVRHYYEDYEHRIIHRCPILNQRNKRQDDHILLTTTITRVSDLERQIELIKRKLSEPVNAAN